MSKTMNWILTEEDNGKDLLKQQAQQDEWAQMDGDIEYQEHCDRLLKDKDSKEFLDSLDDKSMPF